MGLSNFKLNNLCWSVAFLLLPFPLPLLIGCLCYDCTPSIKPLDLNDACPVGSTQSVCGGNQRETLSLQSTPHTTLARCDVM